MANRYGLQLFLHQPFSPSDVTDPNIIAGIAVSSRGRKFANYPGGLDMNDTNTGSNGKYTVAELFSNNTEKAYPSAAMNNPPGGAINRTTSPPTGAGYKDYLIGVQSVVIDSSDTLWILDTGRVIDPTSGMLLSASGNGPKLVAVDLTSNKVKRTITFSETVAYPDSYLNDVRFDLSRGYGYITDSSVEGRNGLITVDLKSGQSWRHLNNDPRVHPEEQFLSFVWGEPVYSVPAPGQPYTYLGFGADGMASLLLRTGSGLTNQALLFQRTAKISTGVQWHHDICTRFRQLDYKITA